MSNRIAIFWLQIGYLVTLTVLAWLNLAAGIPDSLKVPAQFGPVPTAVLWFGALGGVIISLTGVHDHRYNWEDAYWTWHVARPLVGAAVAIIAVLIIQAGILAIGVDPASNKDLPTKDLFYYLVAFIAGYREETFRGMVKRLGDVILTSDDRGIAPTVLAIVPDHAAAQQTVRLHGSGLRPVESVRFGTNVSPRLNILSDAEIEATLPDGNAGDRVSVTVVTPKGSSVALNAFTYD